MTLFGLNAVAQISPGSVTSSPWPVYVFDTETLEKGMVVLSGVGGIGFLGDNTKSYSIYSGLDLGITSRFLVSFAVSGSQSETSNWKLDGTVIHAKYKIVDRDSFDFAIAGNLERLPYMEDAGYTPFDGHIMGIVQKSVRAFAAYGQIGYSSRKQPFEGFGARYDILGKAIISGNFSYRHDGDFFNGLSEGISGVRAITYATVYVPVGSRVGLTGAVGRTLLPINAGDPATYFCTFGLGVRLR
jgi:hypothetical protein